MAKRGEAQPFTVRYRFDGGREHALGAFPTRDRAEDAARQQRRRVGPEGQECDAWVIDRREKAGAWEAGYLAGHLSALTPNGPTPRNPYDE